VKENKVISNWPSFKLLLSVSRKEVLDRCTYTSKSIKELSSEMSLNPSSVHNHIHKLLKAGFIEVKEKRQINGITEKKYRATALDFILSKNLKSNMTTSMNTDVSKSIQKETLNILEHGKVFKCKHYRVNLSKSETEKAQILINELESLILNSEGSGHHQISVNFTFGEYI
jgi:predicted ArsR family transcriptional regulator